MSMNTADNRVNTTDNRINTADNRRSTADRGSFQKYQGLKCCIKKDIKEVVRTGKLLLFFLLAMGIGVMIMGITVIFTDLPDYLEMELPGFDIQSLENMMSTLYPKIVSLNIGVFSYYIGIFYSLVLVLVINGILPRENKKGKWVLPLEQGYLKSDLILGKIIVYGATADICIFITYILYYLLANTFMFRDMSFGNAFVLAIVHGLNMFIIVAYTMLMSVWFRNGTVAAISMIGTVLFAPDIMNFLPIGKYFPSYMLTFVYDSHTEYSDLVMPLLLNIILLLVTYIFTLRRAEKE